jgi:O-antigen ligase
VRDPQSSAEVGAPSVAVWATVARRRRFDHRGALGAAAAVAAAFAVATGRPLLIVPFFLVPIAAVALGSAVRDVVSLLTVYATLLFVLPSPLIFQPLGAAGTPANILAILLLWWWVHSRLVPGLCPPAGGQPVTAAVLLFAAAVFASYAAVAFRPVMGVELMAADRGILALFGMMGVSLLAAAGISARERLDVLLRRLVALGAFLSVVGLLQFFLAMDVAQYLRLPGLHANYALEQIDQRSTFRRVFGTAAHPIEFGVVLALLLPIAVHCALYAPPALRRRMWCAVAIIATSIPMSLSRSAFVALAVEAIVLVPTWAPKVRWRALQVTAVFAVLMRAAVPGLLGTVKSLFTNISTDPSTQGRTKDYAVFGGYFEQTPVLGRGFYTFVPDLFTTFDNQYLLCLVEIGIVGTVALGVLMGTAIFAAASTRRRATDEETRHLAQAFVAIFWGAAVAFGTFDALSFSMQTGLVFLLIGCAGALCRLVRRGPEDDESTGGAAGRARAAAVPGREVS